MSATPFLSFYTSFSLIFYLVVAFFTNNDKIILENAVGKIAYKFELEFIYIFSVLLQCFNIVEMHSYQTYPCML